MGEIPFSRTKKKIRGKIWGDFLNTIIDKMYNKEIFFIGNVLKMTKQEDNTRSLLDSLMLNQKETVSWVLYDWANSAFATVILAAVLPVYYSSVAAAPLPKPTASAYWGYTNALGLFIIALVSPILGAIADYKGLKKRFLSFFLLFGVLFTSLLFFVGEGGWFLASVLFILAYIGFAGANIFYDSLLPHIAEEDEVDRLSAAGFAIGYLGGGLLLVINLLWILFPSTFGIPTTQMASRLSFLSVGVWWALFSIPIFLNVPEPERRMIQGETRGRNPINAAFYRLKRTFNEIRKYRQAFYFLLAFWLYSDGIGTIIKMAAVYGSEIGIGSGALIGALVVTQFAGIPFAFIFGKLGEKIGTKQSLYIGLSVYALISVGGYFMSTALHFWMLAFAVAIVQGGTQALSRSLYGSMIPKSQSSEFYGFYSISSKIAGIFGPLLFGIVAQLTGSSRWSIVSLIVFFIGGVFLLRIVDVEEGRKVAKKASQNENEKN